MIKNFETLLNLTTKNIQSSGEDKEQNESKSKILNKSK